jgi:hypothetical protein
MHPTYSMTLKFGVAYWTTFQKHICSTKRCKQDNRSYDSLLEWLVKKKCDCLSLQCDKLQLIIEDDALEILGIYNDIYSNVILYYYVKLWIIVVHDYFIKKISSLLKMKKTAKTLVTIFHKCFWIFYSLDLIQIVPHVLIIHLKHCHINILNICDISTTYWPKNMQNHVCMIIIGKFCHIMW